MKKAVILIMMLMFLGKLNYSLAAPPRCRCTDPSKCYPDECSRDKSKDPDCAANTDIGPALPAEDHYLCYRPPDCCTDLVNSKDPYKCCWIERGFCTKEQCAQIEGNNQNCGWYWEDRTGNGYGCTAPRQLYPFGAPTTVPLPTFPPISTPLPVLSPIATPTFIPTPTKPIKTPTAPSPPTKPASVFTTTQTFPPVPTNTPFQPSSFSLPSFYLPEIKINTGEIKHTTQKTLGFFEYLFETIKTYDQKLEKTINDKLEMIIRR